MTQKPSEELFESSDSIRGATPLRHLQKATFDEPLHLAVGGVLEKVEVAYETYGQLNDRRDNAVLICHALSGDSHVAAHDEGDNPGWWDLLVGPGKAIDTDRYFVICPNVLGGCRGTTGPNSTNPATGEPYGRSFPTVTVADMVEVQKRLVDHLQIEKLLAVVGGSMGGHQVLQWAASHPDRVRGVIPIATSPRLSSQSLAFDVVGRNAIIHDPNYRGGQYYDSGPKPDVGLAIARMLGHITYLSPKSMREKFDATRNEPRDVQTDFEKRFSVGSYLAHQGAKFVERFDANSYVTLSLAMDLFDLGSSVEELAEVFSPSQARWLVISFTSDWLFPPSQSRRIVDALVTAGKPVSYCNVRSDCGHDAFLLPDELDSYGELVRAFLLNLSGLGDEVPFTPEADELHASARLVHAGRKDYDRILRLVPEGASVLDLGCGSGGLLDELRSRGHGRIMGVEVKETRVIDCVRRGIEVIQGDLNEGLRVFGDGQFDYVVLSLTLQAVLDVEGLLDEMLRVGKRCIVSFPNFGYHKLRRMLHDQGRAPVSGGLLSYQWYNTPNLRFFTIADFADLCQSKGIRIHDRVALDIEKGEKVEQDPNLNADMAIFVISR